MVADILGHNGHHPMTPTHLRYEAMHRRHRARGADLTNEEVERLLGEAEVLEATANRLEMEEGEALNGLVDLGPPRGST